VILQYCNDDTSFEINFAGTESFVGHEVDGRIPLNQISKNDWNKYSQNKEVKKVKVVKSCALNSSILWDIASCNPLKVDRRFGGACRLHLEGRNI
jgi:hypothetical protein